MNRGGIADLSLLRTLLAICQKSRERRFWEVIDSFVLLAYASLAAFWTLLQRLLVYLIVQTKKITSLNYGNSTSNWKPWRWVWLDLILIRTRIITSYTMKRVSLFESEGTSVETETTTWSEFPHGGKAIVEHMLASEDDINRREQDWESHSQGSK